MFSSSKKNKELRLNKDTVSMYYTSVQYLLIFSLPRGDKPFKVLTYLRYLSLELGKKFSFNYCLESSKF